MHSGFAIYKAGKRTFKEAWFRAILIFFIIFAVYALIMTSEIFIRKVFFENISLNTSLIINLITTVVIYIIMTPLVLGQKAWHMKNAEGSPEKMGRTVYFFGRYFFKGLLFKFILMLITLTIFAISMLPCVLWLYIYMFNIINIPPAITLLLSGLCFLGGIALFLYCRTLFALSQYIFVIRPDIGIFRILRGSIKLMKGKRIVYLSLILRCIPAALSCIFLLPSIYSVPIINSAIAEFAFDICGTGKTLKI